MRPLAILALVTLVAGACKDPAGPKSTPGLSRGMSAELVLGAPTVSILDALGAATPTTLFSVFGSGGATVMSSAFPGPEFTLTQATTITEIGAFLNNCRAINAGVPDCPGTLPFIVQVRPSKDGVPDASTVLASFTLSHDNDPLIISYESVAIDLTLGPGTYFALFAPQGSDAGFLLDNASDPFNYLAGTITMAVLNPATGTSTVEHDRGAVRILGTPATPRAATQLLMDHVRTLVTQGVLSRGQGDGLLAKLTATVQSLETGLTNAACNQLRAFVNQVNGLTGAGKLSAGAGQELIDAAERIRTQIGCGSAVCPAPAQGNSVLVDASRDGGVWWFPQAGPFSPESYHQGQALADYLRDRGYVVQELDRGMTITDDLLLASKIVIRANDFGSYTAAELQAYQHFLACPRTLLLLGDHISDGSQDQLAEMLGVRFTGGVSGFVTEFAAHPITSGVGPLFYNGGAIVDAGYPSTVHILGWLSTGEPVMGVVDHGVANVFFLGEVNGIESVPQPLVDNLIYWGF